jgi:hypothetical protein
MNIIKIKQAAEIAKARTSDKRWLAAIDKAVAGVESGWWIVTELATCLAITTETGKTYFANGECQCEAYRHSQACKHRSLYRLYAIAAEIEETAPEAVCAECPACEDESRYIQMQTMSLAVELMARFGKNQLEMLDDDMLRRVRLAIAA